MPAETSGETLEAIWLRFQERHRLKFPDAKPPSKRAVSGWLSLDNHTLAHWSNAAAHGKHPRWRIPVKRIPEVCHVLEAEDRQDDLMFARLQELQADGEQSDALVALQWLLPFLTETMKRPVLDADERQLLGAYRKVRDRTPGASLTPVPFGAEELLETGLGAWVEAAVQEHVDELASDGPASLEEDHAAQERVLRGMAKRRAGVPAKPASRHDIEKSLFGLRRAMRGAFLT